MGKNKHSYYMVEPWFKTMIYSKDRVECFWQVHEKAIAKGLSLSHGASGYIVRKTGELLMCGSLKDYAKFIVGYE